MSSKLREFEPHPTPWRSKVHEIIFGIDTLAGRNFDKALIFVIMSSIIVVILDSVAAIREKFGYILFILEWFFTIVFTAEYIFRLLSLKRPLRYVFSIFGLVDLISIFPTYFNLLISGSQSLLVVRIIRILRVFRVFKLNNYLEEAEVLSQALKKSKHKIFVFISLVLSIAAIMGALMYLIEGEEYGFTSIPRGMYWAIVTMTTVGYGDISPKTDLGQFAASVLMILGYGIIAVPTGIFSNELAKTSRKGKTDCPRCGLDDHDLDAMYCKRCGKKLS